MITRCYKFRFQKNKKKFNTNKIIEFQRRNETLRSILMIDTDADEIETKKKKQKLND